jgi:GNAT superfamily N-acetyltransferase
MSEPTLLIRPAEDADSHAISILLEQLGYPTPADDVPRRLKAVTEFGHAIAMVADDPVRGVVGLITTHVFPSVHSADPVAWLTTLVTLEAARGEGVGSKLVSFVEDWAAARGAPRIAVTSATHREWAHKFYLDRGYEITGRRFVKILAPEQNR